MTTRLIVNADDFGLTSGVNRAIVQLHDAGVLTSATLMARAAASEEAIAMAKDRPSLGVGCHVVLVDGEPELPASRIPRISDGRERLLPKLGQFLWRIHAQGPGIEVERQIEAEARAQIESLLSRGVRLTHVDTHKHTHMFPRVLRPVLRAARACGIVAVRNPFEPAWSVRATGEAPLSRRTQVQVLRSLKSRFRRIVADEGFATTNGSLGVLATGTLDESTIASLLGTLPADGRTYELVTHPGYNDAELAGAHTRLLSSRETERQALMKIADFENLELISFARLRAPGPVSATPAGESS